MNEMSEAIVNEPYKLPDGWRWVKLREISKEFVNGGTPDTNVLEYWDGEIPWITGADVTEFYVSKGRKYITEAGLSHSATHLVPKNTVLVVTRTGVGKIAIAANDICFSQDITGIICGEKLNPNIWQDISYLEQIILQAFKEVPPSKGLLERIWKI